MALPPYHGAGRPKIDRSPEAKLRNLAMQYGTGKNFLQQARRASIYGMSVAQVFGIEPSGDMQWSSIPMDEFFVHEWRRSSREVSRIYHAATSPHLFALLDREMANLKDEA